MSVMGFAISTVSESTRKGIRVEKNKVKKKRQKEAADQQLAYSNPSHARGGKEIKIRNAPDPKSM